MAEMYSSQTMKLESHNYMLIKAKGNKMKLSIIIALLLYSATSILSAADIAAGKTKASLCVACHGTDGNSNNPDWPSLAGQNAKYLVKQITDFRDGKRKSAQMAPMVATLTDTDIVDIAEFFASQTLKPGSTLEKYVRLGSQIYKGGVAGVMGCIGCHGPTGAGLDAAGFPQVSGQKIPYVITQLKNFKDGSRANDSSGMMNNISAAMNDEQIEAIANYLAGLH